MAVNNEAVKKYPRYLQVRELCSFGHNGLPGVDPPLKWFSPLHLASGPKESFADTSHNALV